MEERTESGGEISRTGSEDQKALAEAYSWYQHNIQKVDSLVYELTIGAKAGRPVRELLDVALEAIDRMIGSELRSQLP